MIENYKEKNILIARYLGYTEHWEENDYDEIEFIDLKGNPKYERDLKFHEAWGHLMPVLDKIEDNYDVGYNCLQVQCEGDTKYQVHIYISRSNINMNNKFECYYEAIVDFIKWYNKNVK